MKNLSRFGAVSVLFFALTLSVFAGEISTGIAPPPPPPSEPATQGQIDTGVAGDIHTTITDEANDDSLTNAAYSVLQGVLSLF